MKITQYPLNPRRFNELLAEAKKPASFLAAIRGMFR